MQGLGELEALVMDVVWNTSAAVRVRDVIDQLENRRTPRFRRCSTICTVKAGYTDNATDGHIGTKPPEAGKKPPPTPCEYFSNRPATRRACCCTSPAALPMTNRRCSPAV